MHEFYCIVFKVTNQLFYIVLAIKDEITHTSEEGLSKIVFNISI